VNRDFKGVWIPAEIWLSKDLTMLEKCLLAEIDSLDRGLTHCYATNKHFASFLGCSEPTVKRGIANLIKYHLVSADYKKTSEGTGRIMKSLPFPQKATDQNDPPHGSKRSEATDQNDPLLIHKRVIQKSDLNFDQTEDEESGPEPDYSALFAEALRLKEAL
jgi:hypothetical protein